jgi:hypothetical protein
MAAGITKRLWEMGDIVDWKLGRQPTIADYFSFLPG